MLIKKQKKQVLIVLDEDLVKRLDELRKALKVSRKALIEYFLERGLKDEQDQTKFSL